MLYMCTNSPKSTRTCQHPSPCYASSSFSSSSSTTIITLQPKVVVVVVVIIMVVVVVVLITIGFLHDCISLIAGSGDRRKDRDASTKPQSQHQLHQLLQVIFHFLSFSCSYFLCYIYLVFLCLCHQLHQLSVCFSSCCFSGCHLQKLDFAGTGRRRKAW